MTREQLEVLNIIRANPYFCRNEYELERRTHQIRNSIRNMIPVLQKKLDDLSRNSLDIDLEAKKILRDEMKKVIRDNFKAVIVKADVNDKMLYFLDKKYHAYLLYYFQPDSIQPYMATMAVNPQGIISFFNPPPQFLDLSTSTPPPGVPLSIQKCRKLCRILKLPEHLLEHGPTIIPLKHAS